MKIKKIILFLLLFFFVFSNLYSQNDLQASAKLSIEPSPDIMAKFPGGMNALYKYFSDNIMFKSEDIQSGITGELVMTFIVDTSGKLSGVEIRKGINTNINSEAIRIVKIMPAWIPAQLHGRLVNTKFTVFMKIDAQKLSAEPMF